MLRCCFHQFAARHSNDDNNGERGINEIIGTVWMITLHPSANVFPIPPWPNVSPEHPGSGFAPAPRSFVTPSLINDAALQMQTNMHNQHHGEQRQEGEHQPPTRKHLTSDYSECRSLAYNARASSQWTAQITHDLISAVTTISNIRACTLTSLCATTLESLSCSKAPDCGKDLLPPFPSLPSSLRSFVAH